MRYECNVDCRLVNVNVNYQPVNLVLCTINSELVMAGVLSF